MPPGGPTVQPMLATSASAPPAGKGWVFEPKLDGYRLVAHLTAGAAKQPVRLFTRSGRDVTAEFAAVADALVAVTARVKDRPLVFDGEVVVQHADEAPQFQSMQRYRDAGAGTLRYYVFDLLRAGPDDLTSQPLST